MSVKNEVKGFNRIVGIFTNVKGTISIFFEDSDHQVYLLEVKGTIVPIGVKGG